MADERIKIPSPVALWDRVDYPSDQSFLASHLPSNCRDKGG
jgi:hypothetical protein